MSQQTSSFLRLSLLRPGDWLVIGAAATLTVWLALSAWTAGTPQRAVIRLAGKIVADTPLDHAQIFSIRGPLGITRVEIASARARIASDPSPRQICVKQGWLTHAGDSALCLPNQTSVELIGKHRLYDSLSY